MYSTQPQSREELLERFDEQGEVYEDGTQELSMYEDDGQFHLNHYGVRVSPDLSVGQGSSRRAFNQAVNSFLRDMGYPADYREEGVV